MRTINPTLTFWTGAIISALVGLLFGLAVKLALPGILSVQKYPTMLALNWAIALFFASLITYILFYFGRFEVKLGSRGLLLYLGSPQGIEFTPGKGWVIPFIFSVKEQNLQTQEIKLLKESYTTQNGIDLTVDAGFAWTVIDIAKYQDIDPSKRDIYLEAQFRSALRSYLYDQDLGLNLQILHGDDPKEAIQMIQQIGVFKGMTKKNGSKTVEESMNQDPNGPLQRYGIKIGPVQIEDVSLEDEIEATATRILNEILQKPALVRDAANKADVVDAMIKSFKKLGVEWDKLTPDAQAEMIDRMFDRALAMEGQGTNARVNFGGQPPKGAFFNVDNKVA